jgi:hypothetical protein
MLTIRNDQMEAFTREALRDFEKFMRAHLDEYFPEQSQALDEKALHETVLYGIQRAAAYGIVAECDVCLYIDSMVQLGRDFDQDPKLPWAAAILNDKKTRDPSARVNQLYDVAVDQLYPEARPDRKGNA